MEVALGAVRRAARGGARRPAHATRHLAHRPCCWPRPRRLAPVTASWRSQLKESAREGRRPEGSQEPRVPGGDHPDRRARAGRARSRGLHRGRAPASGRSIPDEEYVAAGATIVADADEAWGTDGSIDMVLKVKEPVAEEYHRMREGLTLFTYLHLAADKPLTEELLARKVTGIAYETVQLPSGGLPLLYPMSEVAGCLAPQVGRLLAAQGPGRPRRADGRRRRRRQRQGRHHRRRRVRPERRQHRARHGRRRDPARHRPGQAADVVLALQQPGARPGVVQAGDRAAGAARPTW